MADRDSGEALVALGSLSLGAGLGGAVLVTNVLIVRLGQAGIPQPSPEPGASPSFLAIGVITAFVVAAGTAFWRARMFGTRWQRVAVGVLAPTGAMFLAALAMPLDAAFGQVGLAALGGVSLGTAVAGAYIARRAEIGR